MKLFVVEGFIRCGHRVYSLKKYIIARTKSEAKETYRLENPNAKMVTVEYRYEVQRKDGPYVIAQEFRKEAK